MREAVEKIPAEKRWTISTKALTGAIIASGDMLREQVGREKFEEIWGRMWAEQGKAAKQIADALDADGEDAKSAAEALELVTDVSMGPEFKRSVEGTAEKAVIRTTECPWWNRQKVLNNSDICSVACASYCDAFGKTLNPKIKVSGAKSMARGDAECELVWELQG